MSWCWSIVWNFLWKIDFIARYFNLLTNNVQVNERNKHGQSIHTHKNIHKQVRGNNKFKKKRVILILKGKLYQKKLHLF